MISILMYIIPCPVVLTLSMLEGLLVAGLGLEAFILALLFTDVSVIELSLLVAPGGTTLLGRLVFLTAPFGLEGGAAAGGGCSRIVTTVGLTNMPFSGSQ